MGKFDKVKYNNEYNKENYKRCIFNVPKGKEIIIEAHFKSKGYKSLNSYINALIDADMENRHNDKSVNIDGVNNGIIATGGENHININK